VAALREMLGPLSDAGYAQRVSKTVSREGAYSNTYEGYHLTSKGSAVLAAGAAARVMMAVPASVRLLEAEAEKKLQAYTDKLKAHGMLDKVPQSELVAGGEADGPVMRALLNWVRTLEGYRARGYVYIYIYVCMY